MTSPKHDPKHIGKIVPNTPQKSPERPHFGDCGGPKKQPNSKSADSRQTEFGPRNTLVGVGQRVPKNTPKPSSRALPAPIGPHIEKRTKKAPQKVPNGSPKRTKIDPEARGGPQRHPKDRVFRDIDFESDFGPPKVTDGSKKGSGTTAEASPGDEVLQRL